MGVFTSKQRVDTVSHTIIIVQPCSCPEDQQRQITPLHSHEPSMLSTGEEKVDHQQSRNCPLLTTSSKELCDKQTSRNYHSVSALQKACNYNTKPSHHHDSSIVRSKHQIPKEYIYPQGYPLTSGSHSFLKTELTIDHKEQGHWLEGTLITRYQSIKESDTTFGEIFLSASSQQWNPSNSVSHLSQPASLNNSFNKEDEIGKLESNIICENELLCGNTITKIASKKDEVAFHQDIHTVLSSWTECGQFMAIKLYTHTVPPGELKNIANLAHFLTKDSSTYLRLLEGSPSHYRQLAKLYALYIWVCTNISWSNESLSTKGEDLKTLSEEILLNRSTCSATGYSILFVALANAAGFESNVINGDISHFNLLTAFIKPQRNRLFTPHSWNAVKVEGIWLLLDCTCGAGYMGNSRDHNLIYLIYYFAIPPSWLILTHWPNNQEWQLLKDTITLKELEPIIECPAYVFGMGIKPKTWSRWITLRGNEQATSIDLIASHSLKISGNLKLLNGLQEEIVSNFDNLILIQRDSDYVKIHVVLPCKGYFVFTVLASTDEEQVYSTQVCLCYQIETTVDPVGKIGYPIVYGMVAMAFDFKLVSWSQAGQDCVCETSSGDLNITFTASENTKFAHYLIRGKARSCTANSEETIFKYNSMIVSEACKTSHTDKDKPTYTLKVVFPEKGWWTICLSGMKSTFSTEDIENGFTMLMTYQVYALEDKPVFTYPNILSSQDLVSFCKVDSITAVNGSLKHKFLSSTKMEYQTFISFGHVDAEPLYSFSRIIDLNKPSPPNQYELHAVFPRPGEWYVHVFGQDKLLHPEVQKHHEVFRLFVYVKKAVDNTVIIQVDYDFTKQIQLTIPDEGCVTFSDIGLPLSIEFQCGQKGVIFQHQLTPLGKVLNKVYEGYETKLEHCSYLQYPLTDNKVSGADSDYNEYLPSTKRCDQNVSSSSSQVTLPMSKLLQDHIHLHISFPWAGKWLIELFAKPLHSEIFTQAFHINLNITKPSPRVNYPSLLPGFSEFGFSIPVEATSYNPFSSTDSFELPFNTPGNFRFVWSVKLDGHDSKKLRKQAFVHQLDQACTHHSFQLVFCRTGNWTARLFGRPIPEIDHSTESSSNVFVPIFELSFFSEAVNKNVSFPLLYDSFRDFGLTIEKRNLPFISHVTSVPMTLVLPFISPPDVKFWHSVHHINDKGRELSTMVSNPDTGLNKLKLHITVSGMFCVSLWAQPLHSTDREWKLVLRHTIKCTTT